VVVGTVNNSITNLGELAHGDGSIAVFGAILPQPTEENPHLYGLADYGVTITGGEVLHTMLGYRR
jgi:hypothetical protein